MFLTKPTKTIFFLSSSFLFLIIDLLYIFCFISMFDWNYINMRVYIFKCAWIYFPCPNPELGLGNKIFQLACLFVLWSNSRCNSQRQRNMFCTRFFFFWLPFLNQNLLKQEQIVYFSGKISCRAVYLWRRQNKLRCVRSCQWRNVSLSATVWLCDLFCSSGTEE